MQVGKGYERRGGGGWQGWGRCREEGMQGGKDGEGQRPGGGGVTQTPQRSRGWTTMYIHRAEWSSFSHKRASPASVGVDKGGGGGGGGGGSNSYRK